MRKIEEIEKDITNHLVDIKLLADEGGFSDYLVMSISNGRVSANNDYWEEHKNDGIKIDIHLYDWEIERIKSEINS